MSSDTRIRVVLYRQGKTWIAQALEYDLASQGKTINAAIHSLLATVADTYQFTCDRFGKPFAGVKEAPQEFHRMFDEAEDDWFPQVENPGLPVQPHIAARFLEECATP